MIIMKTGTHLNVIKQRSTLNIKGHKRRASPETDECKAFHIQLQFMLREKLIPDIFQYTHLPMERIKPRSIKEVGLYHGYLIHLSDMGTKKGMPDYVFVFNDNKGVIYFEFKAITYKDNGKVKYKGKSSPDQLLFQKDCQQRNIPYHIVHKKEEAIEILKEYIIHIS